MDEQPTNVATWRELRLKKLVQSRSSGARKRVDFFAQGLRRVQIQDCTSNENQLCVVLEQSAIHQDPSRLEARPSQIFDMEW